MNLANRKTKKRFRIRCALPWPVAQRGAAAPRPGARWMLLRGRDHGRPQNHRWSWVQHPSQECQNLAGRPRCKPEQPRSSCLLYSSYSLLILLRVFQFTLLGKVKTFFPVNTTVLLRSSFWFYYPLPKSKRSSYFVCRALPLHSNTHVVSTHTVGNTEHYLVPLFTKDILATTHHISLRPDLFYVL